MAKKKTVKTVKKVKKTKAPKKSNKVEMTVEGTKSDTYVVGMQAIPEDFKDQIKTVLAHLLTLFKASLLDAFKQYVEEMIRREQPASAEEFMLNFKNSTIAHGVTAVELIDSLDDDYAKEYVKGSKDAVKPPYKLPVTAPPRELAVAPVKSPPGAAPAPKLEQAPADNNNKSVFDSLDIL